MAFARKFKPKYSAYQVCVTILEARHLQQNANPIVVVKVGNRKKRTMVRDRTDCPVYNEYFVFDFVCNLDALLGTRIVIAVYTRNWLRQLKFYGNCVLEVATVWEQPDHQYYHKWAMLTDPKDPAAGPKGYVKCNVIVNAKGEKMKAHPETEGEDDIEGNLLLPIGGELVPFRQQARYIFAVYRADGLPDMAGSCGWDDPESINPCVQISFAGMKASTVQAWRTCSPRFNERIVFNEMFPPFSRRIRIAVKHRVDSCRTRVVAVHTLNTTAISNSGEYGFLPTFGPSFIHLYGSEPAEKNSCSGKCSPTLPFYRGRVLLSLKTEMDSPDASPGIGVETEPTGAIIERSLWDTDEYLLVAVLYDVCMIDRRRFATKSISFEISLGNAGNHRFSKSQCVEDCNDDLADEQNLPSRPEFESQTVPRATGTLDGKYNYLPLGSRKPCLYAKSRWPNLNWRMYNSNSLSFIADFLEAELEKLEALVAAECAGAHRTYNETIRSLRDHCTQYLRALNTGRYDDEGGTTKLDRHRVNMCRKQIEDVLERIESNGELPNNHYIKIAMIHAYQHATAIRKLCEDPQHSLPDVFIWMTAGSRRVAYSRLSARQIIYSERAMEAGRECGQRINVFAKRPDDEADVADYTACKVELFLWLGNASYANACWSAIPPGYDVDYEMNIDSFPKYFEYNQSATFQLRAHVFQGRFDPGMDASGLLDPVVSVAFHGYTSTTRVIRQSLDPFWDQTLIFPPVTIYGTKESIKAAPPKVVLQVFDQDLCGREFCGRCTAVPLVKLASETYSPPDFPPKLEWYRFKSQRDCSGSVLAAFELIETGDCDIIDVPVNASAKDQIYNIPPDIRPRMTSYRLEVIFWGVRDMKKISYTPVHKPRIIIECAGVHVKSEVMDNAKKFCNFEESHIVVDLDMPELDIYYPCVTIKAYDSRGFGCFKYAGICIIPSISVFLRQLITERDYRAQIYETKSAQKYHRMRKHSAAVFPLPANYDPSKDESRNLITYKKLGENDIRARLRKIVETLKSLFGSNDRQTKEPVIYGADDDEALDWWSKYFASLEEEKNAERGIVRNIQRDRKPVAAFKVQPGFEGFQDRLTTFELWKGKRTGDPDYDDANFTGKFKGHICVYRWPHPEKLPCLTRSGRNAVNGLCDDYPPREPVKLLVRLYVVKGVNLQPKDPLTGKSDPYICVRLGKNVINDRKNYIANQLNPTFGRLFEIEATFPQDYMLSIEVWDLDATTSDDLIGETRVDIENRFYSRHRAHCGIPRMYSATGYNAWRDRERPTKILEQLCRRNSLPMPEYDDDGVTIGKRSFPFLALLDRGDIDREECMALNVLHQWQEFPICGCALVPEHIERRPLFNAKRPGLEQGKLEMWIDMFQCGQLPPKPPVDIAPQVPEEYEIRVVVWNTEDVALVESQFLTGEKSSDIYVKGWIVYEDYQKTDVHYNSLSGEGNFNWRFVFRVMYSKGEHVMIVRRKMSVLARSETEQKLPCRLHLQVWDSDHFSPDDFLGSLTLDLSRMPRGSANAKSCTLKVLDPQLPTVNLFKVTRTKAWWPFVRSDNGGRYAQAGKVQLELSVLRASEADEKPAGRGREPPQSLPQPNRPETSFSWFRNPWKACCFVVCRYYRWRIVFCLLAVLLVLLAACGVYAFPGYFVKRLLNA